ncbi:MAG: hypothetical protein HZB13_12385 [Acidobacteria bacterium]|nr:hypothetical protein [Acidobacteriota bacterium]
MKTLPMAPPVEAARRRYAIPAHFWLAGAVLALAVLAVSGPWSLWPNSHAAPNASSSPMAAVWSNFFNAQEAPIVVFSNAEFVGDPENGLRYYNGATDSRRSVFDHYTGVGEVAAIYELTRLFGSVNKDIRVKRARLLSVDDARCANVVFVGSIAENQVLRVSPFGT